MNAQHSHLVRRPHPGSALSTSSLQRQTSQPHCLSNEEIVVLLYFGYLGFQEEPLCEILKYKCGRVGALDSCLLTIDDLYEDEHLCNRDGNPDAGKIGAYFKRILPNKRKFMSLIRWDSEEETAMAAIFKDKEIKRSVDFETLEDWMTKNAIEEGYFGQK